MRQFLTVCPVIPECSSHKLLVKYEETLVRNLVSKANRQDNDSEDYNYHNNKNFMAYIFSPCGRWITSQLFKFNTVNIKMRQ